MKTRIETCEKCGGLGEYDKPHPMWGSPSCPEAYIGVKCAVCGGKGEVEVEIEPLEEDEDE